MAGIAGLTESTVSMLSRVTAFSSTQGMSLPSSPEEFEKPGGERGSTEAF